jgi:hypothetical protein
MRHPCLHPIRKRPNRVEQSAEGHFGVRQAAAFLSPTLLDNTPFQSRNFAAAP